MSRRFWRRTLGVLAIAWCVPLVGGAQVQATPEEFARRQYESGLEFLRAGKHAEALKDFEAVVDIYPASSVADEALLAIARFQLDVQRNPVAAQATAESLLKKFPASDSVAMSYVVAGQATVAKGLTPGNVDAALASFDRVQRRLRRRLWLRETRSDGLGGARRRSTSSMRSRSPTRAHRGRRPRGCQVPRAWQRAAVRSTRFRSCNV
jgi:tetratricopeptide (TPR) repeat protein